jgi:hypothetical protein
MIISEEEEDDDDVVADVCLTLSTVRIGRLG